MKQFYQLSAGKVCRLFAIALLPLLLLLPMLTNAQTAHKLKDGNYIQNFASIASWGADFASGDAAFSKATPSPTHPNQNTVFATGSSGGVQKGVASIVHGTESIVLLATGGANTDGNNAAAFDLSLDFTGTTAGTISVDWASVNNSTGDRKSTFTIQANTGTDGAFVEIPGSTVVITNNAATNGALSQIALPAGFNGKADAKLRFFMITSAGGTTGNRPKMNLDNISVTATVIPTGPGAAVNLSATALPFGDVEVGSVSTVKTFTVSGQNLTGDITITPAAGFEVRVGENAFACCAITLPVQDGTLESTTIEVRFTPTAVEAYSANLVVSGGGADAQNIALTGTGIAPIQPATLATVAVTDITTNTAVAGGEITSDGGSPVTARGVVWALVANPTLEDSKTVDGEGTGAFTSNITGLTNNTTYYIRAYATNAVGTTYGQELTFKTEAVQLASEPATAAGITISEVTATSMKLTLAGGDGAKRLVLARLGSAVDATPADGTTYAANAEFKKGQQIGTDNYVVFNGTENEVIVTSLRGGNDYHFAVFEYNDNDTEAAENYLTTTSGKANQTTAQAADVLAFEENFDYTSETLLTSNGWTAHSGAGTNAIPVAATGLTYTGYAASGIGNSADLKATGEDVNRTFGTINPGTPVYVATMVNVASVKGTGDYFLHLGPSNMGTSILRSRVYVRPGAEGKIQFGVSGSGAVQEFTTQEYDLNTTYLLVVKYTFDETGSKTTLYVNPALNAEPATAQAASEEPGDKSPIDINTIALRQGGTANLPVLTIDGIRVATSYSLAIGASTSTKNTQQITFAAIGDKTFGASPVTLTATSDSGLPVSFTVVSGPATIDGNTLTITGAGQVRIKASQAGNDAYEAAETEQTFCVNPVMSVISIADMVLNVSNPTTGATTYQWYLNGTPINGATASSYTATGAGSYTVVAKAGNCASEVSAAKVIAPTGIADATKGQFSLYPNPVNGNDVRLLLPERIAASAKITMVVYSSEGRKVFTVTGTQKTIQTALSQHVGSLSAGIYMVLVDTGKEYFQTKMVKN